MQYFILKNTAKGGNFTKNLKIVLCSICSKYVHSPLAPWCLAAGLRTYCNTSFDYKIIEGTINEPLEKIYERIIDENPDIVGLSCYIWNIKSVLKLGETLKKVLPNSKIVLGGPEVSYNADSLLKENSWCDYIISGEGEYPFAKLCEKIATNSTTEIPGLCYKNGDNFVIAEPYISESDPPSPYCDEYFSVLKGRICYLETSRGCPYSCAFCLSGRCGSVHFFDIDRAKNEMLLLANSGTQTVKLVDRTFNANKNRAKEIFRFIINEHGKGIPKNICFHFEIAGDILDDETIEILAGAPKGSMQLEIGLQSFNEKTLSYINRKTNTEKLIENIKQLLKPRNIHIHIDLIAGLPYEDLESFKSSFDKAYELKPNMLQLGFLKLLHGAPMREEKEKYPCEFCESPPYEVKRTPWINEDDITVIHIVEDALERLYNSGRFCRTLDYIFENTHCSPFELFFSFGKFAVKENNNPFISLDDYTELVYRYFPTIKGIGTTELKNNMICDRISTNSSGKLPDCLKVKNENIKKIHSNIENQECYRRIPNVKRGFALLEEKNIAVYSDYTNVDPVNGTYELHIVEYDVV